jgi:hypothetical protein
MENPLQLYTLNNTSWILRFVQDDKTGAIVSNRV